MAKNLQAGLRQSIKASRKAGVTGAGIFSLAPLDLRFALQKTLDPRVSFTRASTGTFVGSNGLIQSATTNEARFDHNPTTGENLGLLVEEARTNGIRNNTMVGAVAGTPGTNPTLWQYVTTQSNGLAVSVIGTGTESGINYIDYRFNGTTVASPNGIAFGIDLTTAATAQTWTNSLYWKLAGGTATGVTAWQIGVIETTAGGSFITGANYTQTVPTSAALITQRPAATRTLSGGSTVGGVQMTLSISVTGNTAMDFTLRIGLPQLEQGAFATSVIPTTTATATRSADVASITGTNFSSFYNQTEGTWFVHSDIRQLLLVASNNSFDERQPQMGLGGSLVYDFYSITGGVIQANNTGSTHIMGIPDKVIYALKANNFIGACNGLLTTADTSGSFGSSITQLNIGAFHSGGAVAGGTFRRIAYWPTRLPNNTLQAISQP